MQMQFSGEGKSTKITYTKEKKGGVYAPLL